MKKGMESGERRAETGERKPSTLDPRPSTAATRRPARIRSYRPAGGSEDGLPRIQVSALRFQLYPFRAPRSAFSLVELAIALGIASFCLVAMMGLVPMGLKSARNTTDQTAASILLDGVALDLRSVPAGSNTTQIYAITLPAAGTPGASVNNSFFFNEDGSKNSVGTSLPARYGILLTMSNPTSNTTTAWIRIYWPSTLQADSLSNALGIVESFVTINRR